MPKQFFYFGIIPGLLFQFVGAYFYFVVIENALVAQVVYSAVKILIIIWPLVWVIAGYPLPAMSVQKNQVRSCVYGLIVGIAIGAIIFLFWEYWQTAVAPFTPNIVGKIFTLHLAAYYIPFAIFLSIIHSFIEEYYWRWFIFRGLLMRCTPVHAALISSFFFASHHYLVLSQFFPPVLSFAFTTAVFLAGVGWCTIYQRTGSLLGSWISHICADAAIMTIGWMLLH